MEAALRYELEQHIPELSGNIYPTHATETYAKPYLVYARINTDEEETLDGYTGNEALSFMFSCMAVKYGDMLSLRDKVVALLKTFPLTSIGTEQIYIQKIKMNNVTETWENELKVNRGIVDFTIYI
jgi:hypothetical protein